MSNKGDVQLRGREVCCCRNCQTDRSQSNKNNSEDFCDVVFFVIFKKFSTMGDIYPDTEAYKDQSLVDWLRARTKAA